MNVIVNNLLVNYVDQGKGPTILMLHGWGDSLGTFDALVKQFDPKYRIVRLDLPGFGQSQAAVGALGLDDFAAYVQQFLAKVSVEPMVIIGHSNGGAIAIKGLSSGRLRSDKLVLLASAGIRSRNKSRKLAWRFVAKAGKSVTSVLPKGAQSTLRGRLYKVSGSDMLIAPHMEATFKRIVSEDVQKDAQSLRLPTLILNGTDDTATPPEYAVLFSKAITGSKLEIVDQGDHFMHQAKAEQVAENIEAFLRV